jgi:hypothetical protein
VKPRIVLGAVFRMVHCGNALDTAICIEFTAENSTDAPPFTLLEGRAVPY